MISLVSIMMCFGVAMDAFVVSLGKGLALKKITLRAMLTVGIWFGAFHMLMPTIGWFAGESVGEFIDKFDHWVMFIVMLVLGVMFIKDGLLEEEDESNELTKDLSYVTMLPLAVATSIDAFAVGIYYSASTIDIIEGIIGLGIVTMGMSALGVYLGGRVGTVFGRPASVLGGIILIAIGIIAVLDHYGIVHII